MTKSRSILNDGVWVAATQVLSAIGQLIGVRLLTELLSPAVFGEINLWLAAVALIASGLANPTMQVLLRFYPEYARHNQASLVRTVARRQLVKLCTYLSPVILLAALISITQHWLHWPVIFLFGLLAVMEMTRMQNVAVLNAIRSQRAFGLWQVLESWLRPLLACTTILLLGENQVFVLAAFLVASFGIWFFMHSQVPKSHDSDNKQELIKIERRFWKYTLPLLPLGIFGWISGMGDRYLIANLMSVADVGIYVAVYGLASRPMFMLAGIIETTIRPIYHHAVISGDTQQQRNILTRWFFMLAICSLVVFLAAYFAHSWIAYFLLGPEFRSGSYLIPWLVLGHILLVFGQFFTRILYANENTKAVAVIEISGALTAITSSYFLIQSMGLKGAVLAVVIGYTVQLGIAAYIQQRCPSSRVVE